MFLLLQNLNLKLAAISVIKVEKHTKPTVLKVETFCNAASLYPPLLKQPFCDYFGHDQYVLVKIVLSFQSRLELDNKLDHDAFKDLVAGGV